ncbi:MAG: hypothetical protein IKC37_01025 [Clostridia bacterium]|nr:hypothetical protein [Clostridia bacterium]
MVSVYNDADYEAVLKQKRTLLIVFWALTAAYLAWCVGWLIYYTTLPVYPEIDRILPQVAVYAATGVYIVFVVPFIGIKFNRVNKYCKMIELLSVGTKNVEENYFMGFYKKQLQKDSVDVISCVFRTWNKKSRDWSEREVYFDNEQDWPELERGDYVRYVVQANFIIQYEVLRVGAMQEDVEKGLIPKDMLEEDRPVFGKIYNVVADAEGTEEKPAEKVEENESAEESAQEDTATPAEEEVKEETSVEEAEEITQEKTKEGDNA